MRSSLPTQLLDTLTTADVVVLALPSTTETPPLVDATFLDAMADGSVLVNIARRSSSTRARSSPHSTVAAEAAILDVMQTEPLPEASPSGRTLTSSSRRTTRPVDMPGTTATTTCSSTTWVATPAARRCATRSPII